jgi:hypothetical protein
MILEAIQSHLQAEGINTTIYLNFKPPQPETCIILYQTAGYPPDPKHQYSTTGLQISVNAVDYLTTRNLSFQCYGILQSFASSIEAAVLDGGLYVTDMQALQAPFYLGRDELNRNQFVQNYIIEYYEELPNRS